jgi:hypothetical protein
MSFCADKNKLLAPSAGGKSQIAGVNGGFGKSVRSADAPICATAILAPTTSRKRRRCP